jgi:membrane associated rhomboid family serine protease
MGAYLILYPRAKVLTWLFVLVFYVPAWVMLGYWFVLQFLSGTATSITPATQRGPGVAFWAHVGGFIAGIVLIKIFPERPQRRRYGTW